MKKPGRPINPSSLNQKCIAAGLPYAVVYLRIHVHNWPEERALSAPVAKRGKRSTQLANTAPIE